MRHRKAGLKLKRDIGARRALLRGLVTNVIEEERITTTVPKAKAARPLVERMITLAKEDNLHARRQAAAFLMTKSSVEKLFEKLGPRFNQRNGGYTRIVKLGWRKGDGAETAKSKGPALAGSAPLDCSIVDAEGAALAPCYVASPPPAALDGGAIPPRRAR